MSTMREDAQRIIEDAIAAVMPGNAVKKALEGWGEKSVHIIAIGKAAWEMAGAAAGCVGEVRGGLVITKYDHSRGDIPGLSIIEAGHPVPDDNTLRAGRAAVEYAKKLGPEDTLLFLVSGGGSALFELPMEGIGLDDLARINAQLLASGADITEMNALRKHLSSVKGGRFAQLCGGAAIENIVLSDVLGDRLDVIASGPTVPDLSTSADALAVAEKYGIDCGPALLAALERETPKELPHVHSRVIGSVRRLCEAAAQSAAVLGYRPCTLTDRLDCEAREAGRFLAATARSIHDGVSSLQRPVALLCGGETVVHLTGKGKGGRNQELALAAAEGIAELPDTLLFSLGSDGTDGPTDAAGGLVDGDTAKKCEEKGIVLPEVLRNNDAYTALAALDGLLLTGPTGTNVNDIAVLLMR